MDCGCLVLIIQFSVERKQHSTKGSSPKVEAVFFQSSCFLPELFSPRAVFYK